MVISFHLMHPPSKEEEDPQQPEPPKDPMVHCVCFQDNGLNSNKSFPFKKPNNDADNFDFPKGGGSDEDKVLRFCLPSFTCVLTGTSKPSKDDSFLVRSHLHTFSAPIKQAEEEAYRPGG